jgi:hypothetical protein
LRTSDIAQKLTSYRPSVRTMKTPSLRWGALTAEISINKAYGILMRETTEKPSLL